MTLFAGQVLRIDQTTGEASATYLTVSDTDTTMSSQDPGTTYNLCGIDMAAPPALDFRLITGTLLDGSAFSITAAHFSDRGKDFYILPTSFAREGVASVATSTSSGPIAPFDYFSHGLTVDDEPLFAGQALSVRFNGAGRPRQTDVVGALVTDDDPFLQLDGAEVGAGAQIMFGPDYSTPLDFNTADVGAAHMVLVKVRYHGTTSDGTFLAPRYAVPAGNGEQVYYLPSTGWIDLSNVISFKREVILTGSVNGISYADYSLTQDRDFTLGGAGDDFLQGNPLHNSLIGNLGADSLNGGEGADSFVLGTDGATDRIVDFQDGIDLISLQQTFASLTITDLGNGHIRIIHGGDVLLIDDPTSLSPPT